MTPLSLTIGLSFDKSGHPLQRVQIITKFRCPPPHKKPHPSTSNYFLIVLLNNNAKSTIYTYLHNIHAQWCIECVVRTTLCRLHVALLWRVSSRFLIAHFLIVPYYIFIDPGSKRPLHSLHHALTYYSCQSCLFYRRVLVTWAIFTWSGTRSRDGDWLANSQAWHHQHQHINNRSWSSPLCWIPLHLEETSDIISALQQKVSAYVRENVVCCFV